MTAIQVSGARYVVLVAKHHDGLRCHLEQSEGSRICFCRCLFFRSAAAL
jgi:hypothetical protein